MSDILLVIIGFSIIFLMTTSGSAVVFFFRRDISKRLHCLLIGFAAGVMIAASVWSLLLPSLEQASETMGSFSWVPAAVGFVIGGLFLEFLDKVVPHFHIGTNEEEGPNLHVRKSIKLFLAVMLHNIPEGLAVGFAFGAASAAGEHAAYVSALGLAIGIGIQNLPEGAAVTLPLYQVTRKKMKSFLFGMFSGAVEPLSAIVGFFLASSLVSLQPWMLAFAAGAMIFVVAEDLIPDANVHDNPHSGTWGVMIGFVIMMILDVALG